MCIRDRVIAVRSKATLAGQLLDVFNKAGEDHNVIEPEEKMCIRDSIRPVCAKKGRGSAAPRNKREGSIIMPEKKPFITLEQAQEIICLLYTSVSAAGMALSMRMRSTVQPPKSMRSIDGSVSYTHLDVYKRQV